MAGRFDGKEGGLGPKFVSEFEELYYFMEGDNV
jgi:hypothetical protein